MENTRYVNLPLAGNIQHGIRKENGLPTELGYFIAKTKDVQLELLVKKFTKVYGEKPVKIKVRFFNEKPLTVRKVRYNQSGAVCYCLLGEEVGKERIKNVWKDKKCLTSCEYAKSIDGQKPLCIEEGTLKFLLPDVSLDRVWFLKIRGITVINKISDYMESQKLLGNSLRGDYYIYLKKEKQIKKSNNKTFNNYTIDILKADEDNLNSNSQVVTENLSTDNVQNVDNNSNKNSSSEKIIKKEKIKNGEKSNVINIAEKSKSKFETVKDGEYDLEKCYSFLGLEETFIINKGNKRKYTVGKFISGNSDKEILAIISSELAEELEECNLGTIVVLDMIEKIGKNWVTDCKFVQKCLKKAV